MSKILSILGFVSLGMMLVSCDQKRLSEYNPEYGSMSFLVAAENEYIIGIHPLHNPKRLYEIFGPIADYLSHNIEGANFKIEASRNYAAYDKKFTHVNFTLLSPTLFKQ